MSSPQTVSISSRLYLNSALPAGSCTSPDLPGNLASGVPFRAGSRLPMLARSNQSPGSTSGSLRAITFLQPSSQKGASTNCSLSPFPIAVAPSAPLSTYSAQLRPWSLSSRPQARSRPFPTYRNILLFQYHVSLPTALPQIMRLAAKLFLVPWYLRSVAHGEGLYLTSWILEQSHHLNYREECQICLSNT